MQLQRIIININGFRKIIRFYSVIISSEHTYRVLISARNMIAVDSLDRAILTVLRESARAPFVEIAKRVDVTERTVRTRMKRMEEEGVVRGYTIREAGIGLTALVRIKVGSGTEIGTLAGEFTGWVGVECVYEISGDADLIAIVHVDDTVALRDLLDRVWLTAPGDITSTQTELVLEQY
ncbi:MAG TPA: Lrp/AsnC family transcriptional regulator [Candidatus Poseidoniales archaeon]|nr:Lrp/AsnC family transcriptional regulator [Candidatus Poseidoniales archaeon]